MSDAAKSLREALEADRLPTGRDGHLARAVREHLPALLEEHERRGKALDAIVLEPNGLRGRNPYGRGQLAGLRWAAEIARQALNPTGGE